MTETVLAVSLASSAAFAAGAGTMHLLRSQRSGREARRVALRGMMKQGAMTASFCAVLGAVVGLAMPGAVAAGAGLCMALAYLWVLVAPMLPVRALDRALIQLESSGADKGPALASVRSALEALAAQPRVSAQLPFLCMAAARRLFEAGVPTGALTVLRILEGRDASPEELAKLAYSRAVYAFYAGDIKDARASLDAIDPKSKMSAVVDVRVLDAHLLVREDNPSAALARIAPLDSPIAHAVAAHAHAALGDEQQAEEALDKLAGGYELVLTPAGPATSLARRRALKSVYRG